jgi:hypothetical protein
MRGLCAARREAGTAAKRSPCAIAKHWVAAELGARLRQRTCQLRDIMGRKQILKSGDEQDAVTGWRRALRWKPGERKRIKRRLNRRFRREARLASRGQSELEE